MSPLIPCDGCARHVMTSEMACPFCGSRVSTDRPVPGRPTRRLGRAATFAFGAAIAAAGASGCGESHTPDADASVTEDDAGPIAGDAGVDAGVDSGTIVPPYGAPPDGGGAVPIYGGAPED